MATFPQQVLDDITLGKERYVELNKEYLASLKKGCTNCDLPKDYACLQSILTNLINLSVIGYFNEDAQGLYYQMMLIIGGEIYVQVGPIVDAGPDKSALTSVPQTFNAILTEGTFPIATILWTQESGPPADLSGEDTLNLTVSNFSMGYSVFKITVTDTEGNSDSDTVELEGLSIQATIEFGYSASNPYGSEDEVVLQFEKQVELGATEYDLNFTVAADLKYLVIKESVTEPAKTIWINVAPFTQGVIPDSSMRTPVVIGSFRYYISRVAFPFNSNYTLTLKTT